MRPTKTQTIGGVECVAAELDDAVDLLLEFVTSRRATAIHLVNAYSVALADSDFRYREVLKRGVKFPDGKPLGWVSRARRDRPCLRQVRGPSLFPRVVDRGRSLGVKHFLLGSTPSNLEALERNLRSSYPGAEIVGSYSPPFRPPTTSDLAAQDEVILSSGAQVVWVGLGTPKQDFEVARLASSLPVVAVAVGAAFDFLADPATEAHPIWGRLGLEWLYRLSSEPRRLWKRYLWGNPRFLWAAVRKGRRG